MGTINFSCVCGAKLAVDDGRAGTADSCPYCRRPLIIPQPQPIQMAQAPPAVTLIQPPTGIQVIQPPPAQAPPGPRVSWSGRVSEHITRFAGLEKIEGFSLSEFFSDVLKRRSSEEVEEYLIVGTPSTTPDIERVDTNWPKPWLFFRAFVGAIIVYLGFVYAYQKYENDNMVPGLIIVGSFAVPLAMLIFFMEVNARRNVSLYQVIRLLFAGGIFSLVAALVLGGIFGSERTEWTGAITAGCTEEPAKLLPLLLVLYKQKYRFTLNGLLFGAAIGTGFAAFESAGYAYRSDYMTDVLHEINVRGVLAPFGHIVWTGMCAAALWRVKGSRRFEFEMLKDWRFLRIFLMAVGMHIAWDCPIDLPLYIKYWALGLVAWVIVLSFIQAGLRQLAAEKLEARMKQPPSQVEAIPATV
jgi:protease PrsW